METNCGECKYFNPTEGKKIGDSVPGECMRFPPSPTAEYSVTRSTWHCGEFVRRFTSSLSVKGPANEHANGDGTS